MSGEPITVEQAKEMKRQLEIDILHRIRSYEEVTGMRVTKAELTMFQDTRFFAVSVWMPGPKRKDTT